MKCDGCGVDKTVTVLYGVTLTRIDQRGRETQESRERRLCLACGGGASDDEMRDARDHQPPRAA